MEVLKIAQFHNNYNMSMSRRLASAKVLRPHPGHFSGTFAVGRDFSHAQNPLLMQSCIAYAVSADETCSYNISKEKTSDILRTVNVNYCIPDKIPGYQEMRKWSGYTTLHFAIRSRALDLANELLEKGADLLKQGTEDGCTPVHIAMNSIFTGGPLNLAMPTKEYQDHRSEELQDYHLINTLLSKQVNINSTLNPKNEHRVSHFHIACIIDHVEAVELFARAEEPLEQSINYKLNDGPNEYSQGHITITQQLHGYTPLHCAIEYSSVKAADILLQYGADIHVKNAKGMSCVHLLVKRIMDMTEFITMEECTLCLPCVEEIEKLECIIKSVLNTRAVDDIFVDDIGLSAFHLACTLGDRTIVEHYLKQNVDMNMRVKDESEYWPGWTPLHFAACFHIDTMILLIENGSDITIENSKGETPLDLCARRFTPADVQLILSRKNEFKDIVLSDNSTKLSDLLFAMNDYDKFKDLLQNLKDVNLTIPHSSPIWAGYNLLHLCVTLNEETILGKYTIRFELPEAIEADNECYHHNCNCTEKEEALYSKRIQLCLKCGCSVSMQNAKGQTPIHLAFNMLKKTTVKNLLRHSEKNVADQQNLTLLHIACAVGDLDVVIYLSGKTNVNSQVKNSFYWIKTNDIQCRTTMVNVHAKSTPLHVAVMCDHKEVIEYLLKSNADVYVKDSLDLTPIHLSLSQSGSYLAKLLFKEIPNLRNSTSKTGLSHLHVAVFAGDEKAVERMILEGAEVDCIVDANVKQPSFLADLAGKTPLHVARSDKLEQDWNEAIEVLLKNGANVHAKDLEGISMLQYSIEIKRSRWTIPLVQMIKDGKCEVEGSGITPLHFACGHYDDYDFERFEQLLENGADVNARISTNGEWQGATPLQLLIPSFLFSDEIVGDIVKLLLDNGADVTIDCGGRTSIHLMYLTMGLSTSLFSHDKGNSEFTKQIADLMLESQKSYNVNPVDHRGFSHFHFACARNHVETVKNFLNHGVDVNQSVDPFAKDIGGFTPLHFALAHKSIEVAYLLLERGAGVNAEDAYGNRPLHIAVKKKFVDLSLIETMLSHGADILAKNLEGETLFDCLLKYGDLTLEKLEFFSSHGSLINILDSHQSIFGSAMRSAAPNEFLPILKRLAQVLEVKKLIQNGFNVIQSIVAVRHEGKLTFHNYLSAIEFFMDIGCELDQQNTEGKTALHKAVSFSNLEATNALLQLGADVNVIDCAIECPDLDKIFLTNPIRILVRHSWKMKFIGLEVNDSSLRYFEKPNPLLEQSCQNELKKAKETEIAKNLSVNDFLSEFGAVIRYQRMDSEVRADVDKFFKSTADLRREFPEFSGLLAMQYRKACTRRELLQPAREAIIEICQFSFPDLCLEAILEFFTNSEMKIVIASVEELFN